MSLRKIAIVGGGRWARTIAVVLDKLLPSAAIVSIHSPSNADGVGDWAKKSGISRVRVVNQWPVFDESERPEAVIVANAARFHFSATVPALLAGVPTLVEKPLALTAIDAQLLVDTSKQKSAPLCAGHVFSFARYVETFADNIACCGSVNRIDFIWSDPAIEVRYGEQKFYDPSISVIQDVFPHILSLLRALTTDPVRFCGVAFARGGGKVTLDLQVGESPCTAILERNALRRRRVIQVETTGGSLELDFTTEPGHIRFGGEDKVGDLKWGRAPGPLASMLKAFLAIVVGGSFNDKRLSPILGLEACLIIDLASEAYRAKLSKWLRTRLTHQIDDELHYALTELGISSE